MGLDGPFRLCDPLCRACFPRPLCRIELQRAMRELVAFRPNAVGTQPVPALPAGVQSYREALGNTPDTTGHTIGKGRRDPSRKLPFLGSEDEFSYHTG